MVIDFDIYPQLLSSRKFSTQADTDKFASADRHNLTEI